MITENVFWKAKTYLSRGLVKLVSSHHGHLEFTVNSHTVFFNPAKKSWSCCASTMGKKKVMTGCILFGQGKTCSHILAAQKWLKSEDL